MRAFRITLTFAAALAIAQLAAGCATDRSGLPPVSPELAPQSIPIGLKAGVKASDGQLIIGLNPGHTVDELPTLGGQPPEILGELDFAVPLKMLRLPKGVSIDRAIQAYKDHPAVSLIAPNSSLGMLPRPTGFFDPSPASPNDPMLTSEWAFSDEVTDARALWRRAIDASRVTVAVIDTGVDYRHPDLAGRVLVGYNFKDGNDDVMDHDGHGTHVAGIIAAKGNNGVGVAGVSWTTRILAVKVMDETGGTDYGAIAGIKYAVDAGAKVLNLSFSSDTSDRNPLFDLAIQYAQQHGALVVAAAGNKHAGVSAPANAPGALAISATQDKGYETLATFSNYGPQVFMAAPGDGILSTYPGATYKTMSGTSMAAPIVAGAAATLFGEHPDWSADQVRDALARSVDALGTSGRTNQYGYGRIDLSKLP